MAGTQVGRGLQLAIQESGRGSEVCSLCKIATKIQWKRSESRHFWLVKGNGSEECASKEPYMTVPSIKASIKTCACKN